MVTQLVTYWYVFGISIGMYFENMPIVAQFCIICDLIIENNYKLYLCFSKREIDANNFGPLFEAMYQADTTDCVKLLVCHVFEKPSEKLNPYEQKVYHLFADDLDVVNPTTVKAEYQLAAYVGSFNQTGLCARRYSRCNIAAQDLSELLQQS